MDTQGKHVTALYKNKLLIIFTTQTSVTMVKHIHTGKRKLPVIQRDKSESKEGFQTWLLPKESRFTLYPLPKFHLVFASFVAMIKSETTVGSKWKITCQSKFPVWWFSIDRVHPVLSHLLCISFSWRLQASERKSQGFDSIHDEGPAPDLAGCERVGQPALYSHGNARFMQRHVLSLRTDNLRQTVVSQSCRAFQTLRLVFVFLRESQVKD